MYVNMRNLIQNKNESIVTILVIISLEGPNPKFHQTTGTKFVIYSNLCVLKINKKLMPKIQNFLDYTIQIVQENSQSQHFLKF